MIYIKLHLGKLQIYLFLSMKTSLMKTHRTFRIYWCSFKESIKRKRVDGRKRSMIE